jgi:hypothetical protein
MLPELAVLLKKSSDLGETAAPCRSGGKAGCAGLGCARYSGLARGRPLYTGL